MKPKWNAGLCLLLFALAPCSAIGKNHVVRDGTGHPAALRQSQGIAGTPAMASLEVQMLGALKPGRVFPLGIAVAAFFVFWTMLKLRERSWLARQHELETQVLLRTQMLEDEKAQLLEARDALKSQATRDALTGLLNRASILEVLDREMARAVRDKSTISIVLADLDHFKNINEAHGAAVGDEVLKEVGRRLAQAIRSYDTAGRYGGEEFLLVLPNFEGDTGVERLRRIHDEVCGKSIVTPACTLNVTCSFGVSLLLPEQFYPAEELLERACQAMDTAKHDGRNRIGFFARFEA